MARPAQHCTCNRSDSENKALDGATCSCGKRAAGMPDSHPVRLIETYLMQ